MDNVSTYMKKIFISLMVSISFLLVCKTVHSGQLFFEDKIFQIIIGDLGPQWFYAMKLYAADALTDAVINETINSEKIPKTRIIQGRFVKHFKQAINSFSEGDAQGGIYQVKLAKSVLKDMERSKIRNVLMHFWGLMKSFSIKTIKATARNNSLAIDVLLKNRYDLDSPEWYHLKALYEWQLGNKTTFYNHIEIAEKITNERKQLVDDWLNHGLILDIDITENMLNLCKAVREEAKQ